MAVSLSPLTTYGTDGDTLARLAPAGIQISLVLISLRHASFKPLPTNSTIGQYNITTAMTGKKKLKLMSWYLTQRPVRSPTIVTRGQ